MADVFQGIAEKRLAGKDHHRQRNHPAGPAQQVQRLRRNILADVFRPRVHHDLHHGHAGHAPLPDQMALLLAAARAGKGIVCRHGAIAGGLYGTHPLRRLDLVVLPDDAGTVAARTDLGIVHARHRFQGVLDRQGTGSAVHALDRDIRLPGMTTGIVRRATAELGPLIGVVQHLDPGRRWNGGGNGHGATNSPACRRSTATELLIVRRAVSLCASFTKARAGFRIVPDACR